MRISLFSIVLYQRFILLKGVWTDASLLKFSQTIYVYWSQNIPIVFMNELHHYSAKLSERLRTISLSFGRRNRRRNDIFHKSTVYPISNTDWSCIASNGLLNNSSINLSTRSRFSVSEIVFEVEKKLLWECLVAGWRSFLVLRWRDTCVWSSCFVHEKNEEDKCLP